MAGLQTAQDPVQEKHAVREAEGLASADHSVEICVHDLANLAPHVGLLLGSMILHFSPSFPTQNKVKTEKNEQLVCNINYV